jgi:hypothetical protein
MGSKTFSPNLRNFFFDLVAKVGIFSLVIWLLTSSKVRLALEILWQKKIKPYKEAS